MRPARRALTPTPPARGNGRGYRRLTAGIALIAMLSVLPASAGAQSSSDSPDGWQSDPSFAISFVGRDSSEGPDRYRLTFGFGATFFGTAINSMPLLPAEQSVPILTDGYRAAFPGRQLQDVQPEDSFDFTVPMGTVVSVQWRKGRGSIEYRSLRGDSLILYTDTASPVIYRLIRAEDPIRAEIAVNKAAEVKSFDLAVAAYGRGDPNFRPDVLQVARARKALQEGQDTIAVDATRSHLDDFPEIRDRAEPGGTAQNGLRIHWFRSGTLAQPLFRVDDGIGQASDPSGLPSLMRVYYYKDGVVRTYQRAEDTAFLSGRQPRNDEWAEVFKQYGRIEPAPARWENGQPESDAAARELGELGIAVLRYEPRAAQRSNLFTDFLDWLMSLMSRKQGS